MSKDVHRLMAAAEKDPALAAELAQLDPDTVIRWADAHGYRLTPEEARDLGASHQELEDEDLEQVAGGWSAGSNDPCGP